MPPDALAAAAPASGPPDQSRTYGEAFAEVYDRIFPRGGDADAAAAYLHRLAPGGRFVDLGVGTGRVAVPLARLGATVVGVDTSPPLLDRARAAVLDAGVADRVDLVEADIRRWRAPYAVDVVYCVCATVSMLACRDEQRAVLDHAARALRPGGYLVVETHSPQRIRAVHRTEREITFETPVHGLPGGMESHSTLADDEHWSLAHSWHDGDRGRSATEYSLLTGPDTLDDLALPLGLHPVALHSDWAGAAPDPMSPTYVRVYRVDPGRGPDPSSVGKEEQ